MKITSAPLRLGVYRQRRLKRRKGVYYARKLRRLTAAYRRGDLPLDDLTASVQGWVNHVRYGNTTDLRKALFRSISLTESKENVP